MKIDFTKQQDDFIRENIDKCETLYSLVDMFNGAFPEHSIKYSNLQKHMSKLGIKKGTHNIRKEKVHSVNPIGTIIICKTGNLETRIKTENGYVAANRYITENVFKKSAKSHILIHLNGDKSDFAISNLECVKKSIYYGMCWRKWFFTDPELTKAAILEQQLLEYFPELRHNENQYYNLCRSDRNV